MVDSMPPGGRTKFGPPRYKSTNRNLERMKGKRKDFEEILEDLSKEPEYQNRDLEIKTAYNAFEVSEHLPDVEEVEDALDAYEERLLV